MKKYPMRNIVIIFLCLMLIPLLGCSEDNGTTPVATVPSESSTSTGPKTTAPPMTQPPSSQVDTSTAESPCDLDFDRVGENVEVKGHVMFVDDTAPDVLYADLEEGICRVGITISKSDFSNWSDEEKKAFNVGSDIVVTGNLASYPMPFRPDQQQLVIEIDKAPVIVFGA